MVDFQLKFFASDSVSISISDSSRGDIFSIFPIFHFPFPSFQFPSSMVFSDTRDTSKGWGFSGKCGWKLTMCWCAWGKTLEGNKGSDMNWYRKLLCEICAEKHYFPYHQMYEKNPMLIQYFTIICFSRLVIIINANCTILVFS